jgi:hypothetical protein
MKDGSISSLFINKTARHPTNVWLNAENHPTKGFKERYGWHCTFAPSAPHLSYKSRAWYKVEMSLWEQIQRPLNQGGTWYIAKKIKILERLW